MRKTNKLMLGATAALALGFSVGVGAALLQVDAENSVVTDKGTVYEYQTGSISNYINAYNGTIFSDFDAVNINALTAARSYGLLAKQYVYATGGVTMTGMATAATEKYLVLTLQNTIHLEKVVNVSVNGTAMSSSVYYVDSQFADMAAKTAATSITMPTYTNSEVSKAFGFCGEVVIPVSAFAGVTEINTITVSTALSQTNINVGEAYIADFDTATLALSNKTSIWKPTENNWERYTATLDKAGNTYTSEDIFALTKLDAGEFIYTASYGQSALTTPIVNSFYWQFPQAMINATDGLVHLKDLGVKGLAVDVTVPVNTDSVNFALRLSGEGNTGLAYDDNVVVYQTSTSIAKQNRIQSTGFVSKGNTALLPQGEFTGTLYLPFTTDAFTGNNNTSDPDVVMPVIWLQYENKDTITTDKKNVKFSNVRFVTDDSNYLGNEITISETTNGAISGAVGTTAISDTNKEVIAGTNATFTVTPNEGYKVDTVTVTPKDGTAETVVLDQNNSFTYTVNAPITVSANFVEATEDPDVVMEAEATLTLEEYVYVNYYVTVTPNEGYEIGTVVAGVRIWSADPTADDTATVIDTLLMSAVDGEEGKYRVQSEGYAAKELGDTIWVSLYATVDGVTFETSVFEYGPKVYAMHKLESDTTGDEIKDLCLSLLDYGASAQRYFGYNTGDLANNEVTTEMREAVEAYRATLTQASE